MQNFTKPAQALWAKVPSEFRVKILNSVWCSNCLEAVTMLNIKGSVESGDLILRGECERCGKPVAR